MKAHIGAHAESGLVHHVQGTAANVADVTQVAELLHGEESAVYADAGDTGIEKREEHENRGILWQIAARRSTYSRFNQYSVLYKSQAQDRVLQSSDSGQGRASISGNKASAWLSESALSWADENTARLTTLFAL